MLNAMNRKRKRNNSLSVDQRRRYYMFHRRHQSSQGLIRGFVNVHDHEKIVE